MEIYLDQLSGDNIQLKLKQASLQKKGKKGEVRLEFSILSNTKKIGHGAKNILLSGLREYDSSQLEDVINHYEQRKSDFLTA
jgi:hypothetical protein